MAAARALSFDHLASARARREGETAKPSAYPADPISPLQVKALERSAPAMGITLQVNYIQTAEEISASTGPSG